MRPGITISFFATALRAQVAPIPAPAPPPPAPVVIVTDRALDGRGGVLRNVRISVAQGRIVSVGDASPNAGPTIDLRGYTVLPGWIDTHVHLDSHFDRTGRIAPRSEPPAE